MTVSDNLPIKRLKIKLKNTEFVVTRISQQVWINGNKESMMKKSNKATPHSSDILKSYGADSFKVGFPMQISRKRGLLEVIDSVVNKRQKIKKSNEATPHSSDILKSYGADSLKVGFPMQSSRKCRPLDSVVNKRQKMDPSLKRLCFSILEELIKHPAAWAFNQPVDPEKLNIPDYFSVVSSPMDLGTVRTKLQDNMYFSVKEFKDDVRLTFSNAILYNPSDNFFNITAKKLDSIFNTKWKSQEARFKCESINRKQSCLSSGRERKTVETEHLCPRSSPMHSGLAPTMSLSFLEKKERTEATRGNITENSKMLDARAANEVPARNIQNSRCPGKVLQKGTVSGNRSTCGSVKITASLSMVASRCRSCGSLKCHCSPQNGYAYASKTLASERYTGQDCDTSKMDHESSLISNTCKSDPESDGTVSAWDGENICSSPLSSSLGTSAASANGWTPAIDLQLSPKKALRAAMLKERFADTILKAKQKALFNHVDKVDPVKLQQEKEKLERQQQEEKARIVAQIRAAKVASSLRAREELRIQREREREALQKMEKTVEIEDNLSIFKELDMFCLSLPSNHLFDGSDKSEVVFEASQSGRFGNILERLGLFLKADYMDYEDEEDGLILHDFGHHSVLAF